VDPVTVELTFPESMCRETFALETGAVRKDPGRVARDEFQLVILAAPDSRANVDNRDKKPAAELCLPHGEPLRCSRSIPRAIWTQAFLPIGNRYGKFLM
jgi:hypothetical protein